MRTHRSDTAAGFRAHPRRASAVAAIAEGLPVSRPAVSQHPKVLREAGLITERRNGTRRLYAANPQALGELRAAIEAMWHEALGGMATAIDKEPEG